MTRRGFLTALAALPIAGRAPRPPSTVVIRLPIRKMMGRIRFTQEAMKHYYPDWTPPNA